MQPSFPEVVVVEVAGELHASLQVERPPATDDPCVMRATTTRSLESYVST
jgi:hypothetical protein